MNLKEKNVKGTNLKNSKITLKEVKKQVKRNYTYSSCSHNHSPSNTCGSCNKLNSRR